MMDEVKFLGGLTVITVSVIALLVYVGRKLSNAAESNKAFVQLPLYVTRTGTMFFAFVAAFWVCCMAVRVLAPYSLFGEYLGTFDGATAVIFGSIIFVAIAWLVCDKLGYPFAKWNKDAES